ncbi:MAG: zf-HC2 domain-containing protein [Acidobacteria bacterium]|nr:zf-HC2 domain-containing protein [Acidobacteriota bacterium]
MTEHLTQEQITLYLERRLAGGELRAADAHVAMCEACRESLWAGRKDASFAMAQALAPGADEPLHLQYEELAAFVDRAMDPADEEIARTHLELCTECANEVRELQLLKTSLQQRSVEEAAPVAVRPSLLSRIGEFFRTPLWLPAQAVAVAALTLCVVWVGTQGQRNKVRGMETELSRLQSENSRLRHESQMAQNKVEQLGSELAQLKQGHTVIAVQDGSTRVVLAAGGQLQGLESIPADYRSSVQAALVSGRLPLPAGFSDLLGTRQTLMGTGQRAPFSVRKPMGTKVENARPEFEWQPLPGASSYRVTVFDADLKRVAASVEVGALRWRPREDLPRGVVLTWQVTAIQDGKEVTAPAPPDAEAHFEVLASTGLAQLETARRSCGGSRLALAVQYAKLGLRDEARAQLEELRNTNPESKVIRSLLNALDRPR